MTGLSKKEHHVRCWRTSLYRVFREFYEIDPDHYITMVDESEKILNHEILEVLRSVCDKKEEQRRLVYLVTTCTKSTNCAEALREIVHIQNSTRWLSTRWPEDQQLCKYNIASILAIYKEYMDKTNETAAGLFRDDEDMDLLAFHKDVCSSIKKQKNFTGKS